MKHSNTSFLTASFLKPRSILAFVALSAWLSASVIAQNFPNKPVRMLAGFGAGGGSDAMVRQVSAQMASQLGQTATRFLLQTTV
jgi:tripartite-type tricarboxylate transporter receptor subunit TctC